MSTVAHEGPQVSSNPADDPETAALVQQGMAEVAKHKYTLSDLFDRVIRKNAPVIVDKRPPVPMQLSAEVLEAVRRLPDVFGKTIVTADRALTRSELKAIVEERQVIDLILGALEKRKKESIREVLANHADTLIPAEQREACRRDQNGHYAPWETQNIPVEGTNLKVQRFASGGKPVLTIAHVEALYADGEIDRKTYLAVTRKPDVPRVLDEAGLHKAIQKDPRLFFLMANKAEPTLPTTTVKVEKNT